MTSAAAARWSNAVERARRPGSKVLDDFIARRRIKEYAAAASTSFSTVDKDIIAKLFGGQTYTGRNVTEDFALAVSTLWRCVALKSSTIGALPWAVYKKVGPNKAVEVDDHPLAEVLVYSPNSEMDRMQFREAKAANLALRGAAFSIKEFKSDGNVSSLTPVPTRQCTPRRNPQTNAFEVVINDRGRDVIYPSEKIWNVHGFGFDGLTGASPLSFGRHAIALAAAAEEFGSRFFGNGARASAVLTIPQWLDDEQREKARKNANDMRAGLSNAHRVEVVEGGMKYEEISANPQEAQASELRGDQVVEICRYQGVPPHLAFDLRHGSYNNVETLATEFVTFGILPDLIRFETSAQKQLLKPADRRLYFLRFNFEGLLRANSLERAQFYASMLQNGVFSRNEVREKENLSRIDEDGMDDYTVQSNLVLTQFLDAMVNAGKQAGRGADPVVTQGG